MDLHGSPVPKPKPMIFACPEMNDLLKQIMGKYNMFLDSGNISWNFFADGFPNLFINDVENLRGRNVIFLASLYNISQIFPQLALIYSLPRYLAHSMTLVLPYFPTGTMERIDEEGQIATASTLARLLSVIPNSCTGPVKVMIFDIHALQERFYFSDNIIPIFMSAIPLFLNRLGSHHWQEDIAIAFPDEGSCKRFGPKFGHQFPLIICTKVREGDKRIIKIKEGEPQGKHVFIIDDLVQTGGTLLECKAGLLEMGAIKVSAFVTHAVFPNDSWRKFANESSPSRFSYFYVTDSCPVTTQKIQGVEPFVVLTLMDQIAQTCLKVAS